MDWVLYWQDVRVVRCQIGMRSDWEDVRVSDQQGCKIGKIWQWEDVRLAIC